MPTTSLFLQTGRHLQLIAHSDGIAEIRFDREGESVNTLDGACLDELSAALAIISSEPNLRGVLLSSAKPAFLAGADIEALWALLHASPARQIAFCTRMHQVFCELDDCPLPVACAVNGYALGGGLETALCADYRVLAEDARVGFPEVGFGVLPGAGGTVRSARLAGTAGALDWLVGGRTYSARQALQAGIADAVIDGAALRETALEWLRGAATQADWKVRRERLRGAIALDQEAWNRTQAQAQKTSRHYPAALAITELVARSAPLGRDAAIEQEIQAFSDLAQTPAAKALVAAFMADQQIRKQSKREIRQALPVRQAAVLGAGIMGGGIAYTSALRGTPVLLKDVAQGQLDLGIDEARKLLAKQVDGGRLAPDKADAVLASIKPSLSYDGFETVDVIVEAVVENLKIKQQVLQQVEAECRPDAVLASNTSSLSIAEIASALARPQNLVGMHFFNPVHMMPLVEIVRGPQSSDAAVATALAYALAMGKTPLVVQDCPGFLVNRLLGAYFTAFMHLIREGADFAQIDRVMEAWGWPMGPAYLLDVAGLDTLDKAMTVLGAAYPQVMGTGFRTVIQQLAAAGRYGQKAGSGFFRYERDAHGKPRRTADPAVAELISAVQPNGQHAFDDQTLLDRMMLAMVLEADRCLEQGVVGSAAELDDGMRLGTGFPLHRGGPLWLADVLGPGHVIRRCADFAALGELYSPGTGLQRRAEAGQTFYPQPATIP